MCKNYFKTTCVGGALPFDRLRSARLQANVFSCWYTLNSRSLYYHVRPARQQEYDDVYDAHGN